MFQRQFFWLPQWRHQTQLKLTRDHTSYMHVSWLTAQWPWQPSMGKNLQPFTYNVDVSIWVKNSPKGLKIPNKQTNQLQHFWWSYNLWWASYLGWCFVKCVMFKSNYLTAELGHVFYATWKRIARSFTPFLSSWKICKDLSLFPWRGHSPASQVK